MSSFSSEPLLYIFFFLFLLQEERRGKLEMLQRSFKLKIVLLKSINIMILGDSRICLAGMLNDDAKCS